jgi:hypothetical protein
MNVTDMGALIDNIFSQLICYRIANSQGISTLSFDLSALSTSFRLRQPHFAKAS